MRCEIFLSGLQFFLHKIDLSSSCDFEYQFGREIFGLIEIIILNLIFHILYTHTSLYRPSLALFISELFIAYNPFLNLCVG